MTPKHGKAAFIFVFITVVLDMLALGVAVPVIPKLILQFEQGDMASAAAYSGVFGFIFMAMQFIFSPLIGSLSDSFGRRPVILLSNLGLGLDYLFMALAPTLPWLFVGRLFSGITAASFSAASAYISDITAPEKRAGLFGMLGAAFGIGFVIGPALGGWLGDIDLRLPFFAAGGLSLLNFFYGYFVIPESLPLDRRTPFQWKSANALGSLKLLASRQQLLMLSLALTFSYLAHESLPSMFVLYANHRYGWDNKTVGLVLALVGVSSTLVSAILTGPFVKKFGERATLIFGMFAGTVGFAIYGLAWSGTLFVVGVPFVALWSMGHSGATALMTMQVGPTEQGKLQGALSSLRGVVGMAGPIVFTQSFAAGLRMTPELPGTPYVLAAVMIFFALLISFRTTKAAN